MRLFSGWEDKYNINQERMHIAIKKAKARK